PEPEPEPTGPTKLGTGTFSGTGRSNYQWEVADVWRDGIAYRFIANGWGPGFGSQNVSWEGTSFTITDMQGSPGPDYEPASFPAVFCGAYSDQQSSSSGFCGLPAPLSSIQSLRTGWRWAPNGNNSQYNASYDVWLGSQPN